MKKFISSVLLLTALFSQFALVNTASARIDTDCWDWQPSGMAGIAANDCELAIYDEPPLPDIDRVYVTSHVTSHVYINGVSQGVHDDGGTTGADYPGPLDGSGNVDIEIFRSIFSLVWIDVPGVAVEHNPSCLDGSFDYRQQSNGFFHVYTTRSLCDHFIGFVRQ